MLAVGNVGSAGFEAKNVNRRGGMNRYLNGLNPHSEALIFSSHATTSDKPVGNLE